MDFIYQGTTTPELQQYLAYDVNETRDYQESHRLRDLVQPDVLKAYFKAQKESYFTPEREKVSSRHEELSPSGKYKLVVSSYETSPGSWSYTGGKVYSVGSDTPIAEIHRNYSSFPSLFVEGHENGHDYLIAGEDYQGQTVIELDTGKRRDLLSDGTEKGFGFCWIDYRYEALAKTLVVDGCIWAGPYECRFYDFSDPMAGWSEIEPEEMIDDDRRAPTFEPDGIVKVYQSERPDEDEEDEKKLPPIAAFTLFKREGLKLVKVEEWASEAEKERRIKREEAERKYQEWTENFKATDPLYLAYVELVKDPGLTPESHMGIGQVYDAWLKGYEGAACLGERRWCRRIISHKGKKGSTVDLEWAVATGPIKLVVYLDGKHVEDKFFPHSVEAMHEAFAYAKGVACG